MSEGIEFGKNPAYKNVNNSMYGLYNEPIENCLDSNDCNNNMVIETNKNFEEEYDVKILIEKFDKSSYK